MRLQHLCHHLSFDSAHVGECGYRENRLAQVARARTEWQFMSTQGTVKWFNSEKGFGFIAPDEGGADVFAHYTAIQAGGYRSLEENQRVEFEIAQGPKGLQAENIRPL
ncbi:hypothetical protein GCM10009796_19170 [Microbacterium koreense]